ncbi:MAG: MFS transporter [Hyphomonadaceae bacterium]|nr:MFS transporter [Hyphomonadaceae bacterium]
MDTHTDPARGEAPWPAPTLAWWAVAVLLVAYTVSFIDRMILSLLVAPIRADLQISDFEFSILHGLAFAAFYTLMGLPLGYLADRANRQRIISIGIAFWSVMTALCGLAPTYAALFLARLGVGVGEAALSPAAYSMLSDYFPKHRLGRAMAVYSIGVPLGSGIALIVGGLVVKFATQSPAPVLPVLGETEPWRLVFFMVGLPGLLVALLMLSVREPARRGGEGVRAEKFGAVFAYVGARWRAYGGHFLGLSLLTFVIYGGLAWYPTFFARTYGMAPADAGMIFGVIMAAGGAAGLILGGVLADLLFRKGLRSGHLIAVIIAVASSAPFFVAAPLMASPVGAFALLAPAVLLSSMHGGVAGAALQLITPNAFRGQVTALYFFMANLIGLGLGPMAVAALNDFLFRDDAMLRYAMAIVAACALPLSALVLWSGLGAFARAVAAQDAQAR